MRSDIHLHFDLLDTPEFFWEYPELQDLYHSITNYLEIEQRTRLLTGKLDIIQQLLNMLAEEQNHKHSSILEWIIIPLLLIVVMLVRPTGLIAFTEFKPKELMKPRSRTGEEM